jgi:hypothetical protein
MDVWERARVLALAPDSASASAGQQLADPGRWSSLGCTAQSLWGRCRGSGSQPYQTVVALGAEPAYACSCPSRKFPCKHALALLLLWSAGRVPEAAAEADFAAGWIRGRQQAAGRARPDGDATVTDPEGAARRAAARVDRVSAGLDDLDLWLHDQVRGGLAALERAGYAHFDRVAARMVDAQAPGVASMLRSIPAELAAADWPARVLERLAGLHLLVEAHRRIDSLPDVLAANVRSRVGYPVSKSEVLAGPAVRDRWLAVGVVETVESQLQTRRTWLHGLHSGRYALELAFAPPGMSLDSAASPGEQLEAGLHFYPGSGYRAVVGDRQAVTDAPVPVVQSRTFSELRGDLGRLLADDPWASRLPGTVALTLVRPERPGAPWRARDEAGACADLLGLTGDPWVLLARSGGEPVAVFGEWSVAGFRPLSLLPDQYGGALRTELAA